MDFGLAGRNHLSAAIAGRTGRLARAAHRHLRRRLARRWRLGLGSFVASIGRFLGAFIRRCVTERVIDPMRRRGISLIIPI